MTGEDPARVANTISGGIQFGPVLQGRGIQATFQLPAATPMALAQLPPSITGVTGRDDELAGLARLLDPAGTTVVTAVAGLPGVGKTTVAVQAGHNAQQQGWFGGVLFIDLHGYDEAPMWPFEALDALLRGLGVPGEHIPPTADERAALYRSVLAKITDPVLVIADNASSEAQVRPLLPGTGPHKVMVTSRHTLAGLDARLVDVSVLDAPASIALLDTALQAGRPEDHRITRDRDAASRIAEMCGGLPLALQIVAALLKADPTAPVTVLADDLTVEHERLERLTYDDGTGGFSVVAAFTLSYRRLNRDQARMFRLLPVGPGPDISAAAAAVVADVSEHQAWRTLADLGRAHLIEPAMGTANRWQMHDLMRLYAAQQSDIEADTDGREQAWDRLLDYYVGMTEAANNLVRALPGTEMPETFAGRDDALAWFDTERASLVAAVSRAAGTGRDRVAFYLPILLTEYFDWRRRFDDKLATIRISRDMARRHEDKFNEGVALITLGNGLLQVRRFKEAVGAAQEAAAMFREIGARDREGRALTNLGLAFAGQRRFDEAIAAYEEAAAIHRECGAQQAYGMTLMNLGGAREELGRLPEAISVYQEASAIFREIGDRHSEAGVVTNLAGLLGQTGRPNEAIAGYRQATAIFRETGDRHGEGVVLTNLALVLRKMGRLDEAIAGYQAAVALCRETDDRHGEGIALDNLGMTLKQVGRFDEAITAHQEAVAIYRETDDPHGVSMALRNLEDARAARQS